MITLNTLVISSNSFSKSHNNGKTLECLLQEWDSKCITHMYFDGKKEDMEFCRKFFVVTVYDAVDKFFSFKAKEYIITEGNERLFDVDVKSNVYSKVVNRIYKGMKEEVNLDNSFQRMRNSSKARTPKSRVLDIPLIVQQKWIKKEMLNWISGFKPDLIFLQSTGSVIPFVFALYAKKQFQIPMITQVLDDFTMSIYDNSILESFCVKQYNKLLKRCIVNSSAIITISDYMAKEYEDRFGGGNYYVFSNASDFFCEKRNAYLTRNTINYLYCGNLGHERINVLANLGRVLDRYSEMSDRRFLLTIYSGTKLTHEQKSLIQGIECIEFKGFINPEKLYIEISKADFLLHVESFSPVYRKMVRLSISTKIGEYLSSNRCILAIGPKEVASIDYIKSNELGFVIDNEEFDEIRIEEMISDEKRINRYIENARAEYENRFTDIKVQEMMNKIVSEI